MLSKFIIAYFCRLYKSTFSRRIFNLFIKFIPTNWNLICIKEINSIFSRCFFWLYIPACKNSNSEMRGCYNRLAEAAASPSISPPQHITLNFKLWREGLMERIFEIKLQSWKTVETFRIHERNIFLAQSVLITSPPLSFQLMLLAM